MQVLTWVKLLYYLLLLSSVVRADRQQRPQKLLNDAPGGRERCLREISSRATFLRGGIGNNIQELSDNMEGAYGYVIRVNFYDGVQWAAKISSRESQQRIFSGMQSTKAIEKYCRGIPLPKFYGDIQVIEYTDLIYCFMDWVKGIPLYEIVKYHKVGQVIDGLMNYSLVESTIPRRTVTQLAEFVYNLTTCSLPRAESITREWWTVLILSCSRKTDLKHSRE
jgi:hypothetical protein